MKEENDSEENNFNKFEYEGINLQDYISRVREYDYLNGSFSELPN